MKIKLLSIIVSILILGGFSSCKEKKSPDYNLSKNTDKTSVEKANKFLVEKDIERIKNYADRRNWNIQSTVSGLWFEIYEKKSTVVLKKGQTIYLAYNLSLLDGTNCYNSQKEGLKSFIFGNGTEIQGLEEGVSFLGFGDKARLIIPPYLAYGLIGDQNKIPARAILVYEIEVVKIE